MENHFLKKQLTLISTFFRNYSFSYKYELYVKVKQVFYKLMQGKLKSLLTGTEASSQPTQPSIITNEQSEVKVPKLSVKIKTVNGGQKTLLLDPNTTGLDLKKIIYGECSQSLEIEQMSVIYEGSVIGNKKRLKELSIVTMEQTMVIVQDKITVPQVSNIIADAEGVDPINEEKGVAKMVCGHWISRGTLICLIRSIISDHKFEIRCPFPDQNDLICSSKWEFKDCEKIGVFTKEQLSEFETGLSMNWIQKYTKKCPKCKCHIFKGGLKTDRVVCPSCKYGDFCYLCLKKWIGGSDGRCGNQGCLIPKDLLKMCSFDRVFQFVVNGQKQQFNTPKYRSCIHCNQIIENYIACKHTTCSSCKNKFCWICLCSPIKGAWPCGSFNSYCGKVAQIQNL